MNWVNTRPLICGSPSARGALYWRVQSTLGFTTRGLLANLDVAIGRAVTELCQYLNSDLVFSDLKFQPLCSEIATVKVVVPSGPAS